MCRRTRATHSSRQGFVQCVSRVLTTKLISQAATLDTQLGVGPSSSAHLPALCLTSFAAPDGLPRAHTPGLTFSQTPPLHPPPACAHICGPTAVIRPPQPIHGRVVSQLRHPARARRVRRPAAGGLWRLVLAAGLVARRVQLWLRAPHQQLAWTQHGGDAPGGFVAPGTGRRPAPSAKCSTTGGGPPPCGKVHGQQSVRSSAQPAAHRDKLKAWRPVITAVALLLDSATTHGSCPPAGGCTTHATTPLRTLRPQFMSSLAPLPRRSCGRRCAAAGGTLLSCTRLCTT